MKLSELISELEKLQREHGDDREVFITTHGALPEDGQIIVVDWDRDLLAVVIDTADV